MPRSIGKGGEAGVIFIRADAALLTALRRHLRAERKLRPGAAISQADVARELLWSSLLATREER